MLLTMVDARAVRRIGADSAKSYSPIGMLAGRHANVRSFVTDLSPATRAAA